MSKWAQYAQVSPRYASAHGTLKVSQGAEIIRFSPHGTMNHKLLTSWALGYRMQQSPPKKASWWFPWKSPPPSPEIPGSLARCWPRMHLKFLSLQRHVGRRQLQQMVSEKKWGGTPQIILISHYWPDYLYILVLKSHCFWGSTIFDPPPPSLMCHGTRPEAVGPGPRQGWRHRRVHRWPGWPRGRVRTT